jgi:hypothetical protein
MNTPRPLLLLALVLASVQVAPAAAVQSVPSVLPGDLAIGPAGGVQRFPAIAAGPGVHLVAWADHRSAFETLTTGVGTRDVQAILVDASGAPLMPHSFRVAGDFGRKEDVRVAWNGTHFLVTWQTEVPTTFSKAAGLHAARVDAQGQIVDQPPLVVAAQGAGVPSAAEAQSQSAEQRTQALEALRAWYHDWSETARAVIRRRDYLVMLGLVKRRVRRPSTSDVEGLSNEPA